MPADRPRFHERAQHIPADEIIFDLEDSVTPAAKESARQQLIESLDKLVYPDQTVAVRVNAQATPWFQADVEAAARCNRVDSLVIPKVNSAAEIHELEQLLSTLGRDFALEAQIESAAGLEHAGEIAAASSALEALHLGPFDLAASLGASVAESEIPEEVYVHGLISMLVAARASGRLAIDGPFTDLRNLAGLERSAKRAARFGCDGKWAIHPDQVAILNDAFTPATAELERARAIMMAYERAAAERRGAVTLNGEMLDEATRRWAESVLARGLRSVT
jgi:citrate lyase subunit beta/citryl-CoA lyase